MPRRQSFLRPGLAWLFGFALLLLPAVDGGLAAQDVRDEAVGQEQEEEPAEQEGLELDGEGAREPDLDAINAILEEDQEVFEGRGFTYDPRGRRDPFKSLLAARDQPELRGARPDGVPGLLIDELDLTGVFRTGGRWVAQVQAADKDRGYLLYEGDQLYDGDVVSIDRDEVVFRQIVRDQTALKPFREVAKKLNP
ncbi:MAG: hypothetical protein AAF481_09010 [Acidobacteriota bacterium]